MQNDSRGISDVLNRYKIISEAFEMVLNRYKMIPEAF
jgi:hypothetical protein